VPNTIYPSTDNQFDSCTKKEPFVKLGTGQAPVLDYNLPQQTCFTAVGFLPIALEDEYFKSEHKTKPANNFWDNKASMTQGEIEEAMNDELINNNSDYVMGVKDVSFTAASSVTNLKARKMEGDFATYKKKGVDVVDTDYDYVPLKVQKLKNKIAGLTTTEVAKQVSTGFMPIVRKNLYGDHEVKFVKEPLAPKPLITIVERYKVCSYLSDYGAGKTVKTFSLLPGEKTNISIKTYKDIETLKEEASSVLDSFSRSSASELETLVEGESSLNESENTVKTFAADYDLQIKAGVNLGIVNIGGKTDLGLAYSKTGTSARESSIKVLSRAMDKQTSQASAKREVSINTESSIKVKQGEETSVVRELENINQSRVLNFVFRQLLQEYITITTLNDVQIMFTNGYPESDIVVGLDDIDTLLEQVLNTPAQIEEVRKNIFIELCNVYDHTGTAVSFIEKVEETLNDCIFDTDSVTRSYVRKKKGLTQEAEGFTVEGIILDVKKRMLRTDSVVVDALLGQGEALDCYNMNLQNQAVIKTDLENKALKQQIDTLEAIADPVERANAYKKVFGNCCEVPQSVENYNAGGN